MIKKMALILVIISITGGIYFTNNINVYNIDEQEVYTYLAGKRYDFDGKIELFYENQDKTIMEYKNANYVLTGIPLYFNEENKIVLSKNMLFIDIETGNVKKVNRFTNIYKKENNILLEEGSKKTVANNFILYDGINTYINFAKGVIVEEDKQYEVDKFSFVEGGSQKYFYNFSNGKTSEYSSNYIKFKDNIILDLKNNILTINEKKILLLNNFEEIQSLL